MAGVASAPMRWLTLSVAMAVVVACSGTTSGTGGGGGTATGGGSGGGGGGTGGGFSAGGGSATGGGGATGGGSATGGGGATGGGSATGGGAGGGSATGGGGGGLLSDLYPGDVGIASDPSVVWAENFEEATVSAFAGRYDQVQDQAGIQLVADVPALSSGAHSGQFTSSTSANATDFYKELSPGLDELWVRYYVKYDPGVQWHHSGFWLGGYNPATPYPNPQAGLKPNGDDRFAIAIEPSGADGSANPQLDFYDYWSTMHSWMDTPMGNTAYYGNSLVHQQGFHVDDGQWMCLEIHLAINPTPGTGTGATLAVYKNDALVQQFTDPGALGYWIKDKFCPQLADGTECTNYPPPSGTQMIPLDQTYRTVAALKINYLWPQNYITAGPAGSVWFDDLVAATRRVGCLR